MASYFYSSGSAGNVGPLTRLAGGFVDLVEESRIGHLLGARVPNQTPSGPASLMYFDTSAFRDASGNNTGKRIIGQPVPQVEPGKYTIVNAQLADWGEMAVLDKGDGYAFGDDLDRDEMGVRMSLTHCLDALDKRASEVLTASSTPWTTNDVSGSDWGNTANDPFTNIMGALDS